MSLVLDGLGRRYNRILATLYSRFRLLLSSQTPRWLSRDHFKAIIALARRPEFEQATPRVVVAGLVLIYLFWYVRRQAAVGPEEYKSLVFSRGFLAFSVVL